MNIEELKSRIINRSRDGLAEYSAIRKNSMMIIDLYEIQKYFLIDNILEQLLTKEEVKLESNQINLIKMLRDLEDKLIIANKKNVSEESQSEIRKLENKIKRLNRLQMQYEQEILNLTKPIDFSQWLVSKQGVIKAKLEKIRKKDYDLETETGINCLKLALFYIQGKLYGREQEEIFRAPIIFLKIKIEVIKSKGIINIIVEDYQLNETFFEKLAFINHERLKQSVLDKIDFLFSNKEMQYNLKLMQIIEIVKEEIFKVFGLKITYALNGSFSKITNFSNPSKSKKDLSSVLDFNDFKISNQATIGIFKTTSFQIINDLEKWEEQGGNDFLLNMENLRYDPLNDIPEQYQDFLEQDLVQISKLDFSQKLAILTSLKESTTIQGPPGTGKSQTIINLIINIIAKNKRLLFSAEKKVATEIVYRKLEDFKKFCLKIHDISKDKKMVYEQLKANVKFIVDLSINSFQDKYANNFTNEVEVNTIEDINRTLDYHFNAIKKYKSDINNIHYKKYIECIRNNNVKKILNLAKVVLDYGVVRQYDLSNWKCVADLVSFLEEHYEVIDFYNYHRDNVFIMNNLEHLPAILNFNWKLVFNFKNTIVYFYKTKILKPRPNFLNLIFTKQFKLKFVKEMNDNFNLNNLKDIVLNNQEKWLKVKNLIHDNVNKQYVDELNFIFSNISKDQCNDLVHALYILNFENQNQDIINFNINDTNDTIKNLMVSKIELSKTQLVNNIGINIVHNLNQYKNLNSENHRKWTKFYGMVDKGQRLPPIKKLFQTYHEIINIISPILITSVEVIPIIVPLKKEILDYTIFDEASQIYLENAIAAFYRAEINIVVGDEKQLAPTNHFLKNISEIEEENDEVEVINDRASHFDSLLSYADSKFKKIRLNYHYRSNSKELIEFSNHEFYDSKLIFADTSKKNSLFQPIKVIETNGVWDGQVNQLEADIVIEQLQEILKNKTENETVGIITFNKKQSDLINEKINELSQDIKTDIEIERERKESENRLFIKNLEEVQGDERDIIILAISFAKKPDGSFSRYFGPINKIAGENRINVAITRAKKQIYVIKSFNSNDILKDENIKNGARVFGKYLKYVEKLQEHDLNSSEITSLWQENHSTNHLNQTLVFDSPFEEEVYNGLIESLNKNKYAIETQVKQSSYSIDLAIWDKINQKYILAIECDGYSYHSNFADKVRDYYRQEFLQTRGWTFIRICSRDWWKNRPQYEIINEIKNEVQKVENDSYKVV